MTHDHAPDREQRDALLTAFALDAVTPEERAAVERLLADPANAAARAQVAEVRATAAALRTSRDADAPRGRPNCGGPCSPPQPAGETWRRPSPPSPAAAAASGSGCWRSAPAPPCACCSPG